MESSSRQNSIRIFCNQCRRETNHKCVNSRLKDNVENEEYGIVETYGYRVWACAGCEALTFEESYTIHGITPPEGVELDWVKFYPNREKNKLPGKRFNKLPQKLAAIYRETIGSFNNNLSILCAIGIRALLEGICADQNITGGNLEKKIDRLTSVLPANIVENLHSIRFIGNTAAHELEAPDEVELRLAIEILEDILNFLYDLDYKAERLAKWRADRRFS